MTDCKEGLLHNPISRTRSHTPLTPLARSGQAAVMVLGKMKTFGAESKLIYGVGITLSVSGPYLLCPGGEVEAGVLSLPGLALCPRLSRPPAQSQTLALHPQPELGALAARRLRPRGPVLKQRAGIRERRGSGERGEILAPPRNKIWNLI